MTDNKTLRDQVAEAIAGVMNERGPIVTHYVADAAIKAVLEGMRCGGCKSYREYYELVTNYNRPANTCLDGWAQGEGPGYGCIHWEQKQ